MSKAACKIIICGPPVASAATMPETAGMLDAINAAALELGPGWEGSEANLFAIADELGAQAAKIRAFDRKCANALKAKLMAILPAQASDE